MRSRITVLLEDEEYRRFDAYCSEKGFKKSTLIARLIKEHLDSQNFGMQQQLAFAQSSKPARRAGTDDARPR